MKNGTRKNWFWGIFLLLAGVLVVASQLGSFTNIGFWTIAATVLLAALFVQSLLKLNFPGITFALALAYIIYQKPLELYYVSPWLLLLAALLVGVGLSMLIRRKPRYSQNWDTRPMQDGDYPYNAAHRHSLESSEGGDDDHPTAKISFGAASKYLHSSNLEYGQFEVSFGAMEIYFDQVSLRDNHAEIFIDCSFAGVELFVPRHWRVVNNMNSSLGGVENPAQFAHIDAESPVLTLNGNVSLGGVEVKYV